MQAFRKLQVNNMHNYTYNYHIKSNKISIITKKIHKIIKKKYIKHMKNIYSENHVIFNIPSSQTNLEKVDSSSGLVKMSAI